MKLLLPIPLLLIVAIARADDTDDKIARQLVEVVQDVRAREFVRIEAARTLAQMGPKAAAATDGLTAQLRKFRGTDLADLHEAVLRALGEIGPPARTSLPEMVRSVGRNIDLDLATQQSITRVLTGPERLDVSLLVSRLNDRDPAVRLQSVKSLSSLGFNAVAAVPSLTSSLADPDADVRRAVVTALRAISPKLPPSEALYKVYIQDLGDGDPGIRLRAAKTLGDFGPKANIAVAPLQDSLNDPDRDVRRAAFEALNKISPP